MLLSPYKKHTIYAVCLTSCNEYSERVLVVVLPEAITEAEILEEKLKVIYEEPSFEVLRFKASDVLTASSGHPWVIPDDDDDDDDDGPSW